MYNFTKWIPHRSINITQEFLLWLHIELLGKKMDFDQQKP